jgi:hypothetical protein
MEDASPLRCPECRTSSREEVMTGKRQKRENEQKAAPPTAGPSKARVGGKMHLEDISLGVKQVQSPRDASTGLAKS